MKRLMHVLFIAGLVALESVAADRTWNATAPGTYEFETAENWTGGSGVDADDTFVIARPASGAVIINVNTAFDIGALTIGGGAGAGTVTLNFKNGLSTNVVAGDMTVEAGGKVDVTGTMRVGLPSPCYNYGAEFPMADDYAGLNSATAFRDLTIELGTSAALKITNATWTAGQTIKVKDIDITDASARIYLLGSTIEVQSPVHKMGRGWAVPLETVAVGPGKIVWKKHGLTILLR